MDRIERMCEEVHTYDGTAERTGVVVALRGLRASSRTCTSVTDLIRKYKLYGDGLFYLPVGRCPDGARQLELDNVKWMGVDRAMRARTRRGKGGDRRGG